MDASNPNVTESFRTIPLDPSDSNSPTYRQRYFTSTVNAPTGQPKHAFLCTGGEGPGFTATVLTTSVHCTGDMVALASRLGKKGEEVIMYALEHRYYGLSLPPGDPLSPGYLDHLTSDLALHDVSTFITAMNGLNPTIETWTTFGGSYPGMMSSWSRLRYPDLIGQGVSSSSPVEVVLDMQEYNEKVGDVLAMEAVGGSTECRSLVESGHATISGMLETGEGREALRAMFDVCDVEGMVDPLLPGRNREMFAGDGVVYVPAQENDPSCEGELCDVGKLCAALLEGGGAGEGPVDSLARVAKVQNGGECVDVSWEGRLGLLGSLAGVAGGTRSWLYQTCNEFGFYQTCEVGSSCPFSKGYHPLDQDLEMCATLFNVTDVELRVAKTETYGGWNPEGTRVLYVNGDVDPWSTLSVTVGNPEVVADQATLPHFWCEGASHHFWTHKVLSTDAGEVNEARERIYEQVETWLADPE